MYGYGGVDFGCVAAVDVSSADWAKALWRLDTIGMPMKRLATKLPMIVDPMLQKKSYFKPSYA